MRKLKLHSMLIALCGLAVLTAAPAMAVTTQHWTQSTEADFDAGTMHQVVATNLGQLKLSQSVKTIIEQDPKVTAIYCMAQAADGTIYAGTGPEGQLLAVKDGKATSIATIPDGATVFSILIDSKGAILLGSGGEKGQVFKIDHPGDAPKSIFSADGVQYVYALAQGANGTIYAATGPNGQLFEIKPDGTSDVLYKSTEDNLLSMIADGKGNLYVGTHPNGLVIRIDIASKKPFILYNAAESEITALALDEQGNLYAASGDASQTPTTAQSAASEKEGRPEGETSGASIPAAPPQAPKPPTLPNPNPGEPKPIPKSPQEHASKASGVFWRGTSPMNAVSPDGGVLVMPIDDPGNAPNGGGGNGGGDNPSPAPGNPPDNGQPAPADNSGGNGQTPNGAPGEQPQPAAPAANGNAIYQIDRDGFVTEIFRNPVTIYSMIESAGTLTIGTGPDGNIYQINPATQETVVVAKVDAKEVTSLTKTQDGSIELGMSNPSAIGTMSTGLAQTGAYTSSVLDATQTSRFGNIQLHGSLPDGTSVTVATRSGNTKDPESGGWSDWTPELAASQYLPVASPFARFLQYRLTLSTKNPANTPSIDDVDIAYELPNLAPVVKGIKVEPSQAYLQQQQQQQQAAQAAGKDLPPSAARPIATPVMTIAWDASDPNNDTMSYSLYFRMGRSGPWILLRDKLRDPTYEWDTRNVADGRYEVKVIASDAPNNPAGTEKQTARVSEPFTVDNTPPEIGDLSTVVKGDSATLDLRAVDQTSTVGGVEYSVDSNEDWRFVAPSDMIYDSPSESVTFTVAGLGVGPHQITVRAWDTHGNVALTNITVRISPPAGK